jgi:predicted O-linked N-acetylglucosamine transferase (SPINDLY family)
MDEALAAFQRTAALSSQPVAERIRLATLLPPLYRSREELRGWRERIEREVDSLVREGCVCDLEGRLPPSMTTSFYTAYQGVPNRALHQSIARLYRAPQCDAAQLARDPRAGRRLRIGFLSRYFYNHTIGCFTCGYVARLDRQRFETHVLAINPRLDQMGQFIRQHAERYDELPADLSAARQMILERRLDVLVYPEIGMSPTAYALAASRLAPVQCVTWGHPDTTGLSTIDYFLSSRELEPPGAEEHYSERLVRFEHPPACYYRPTRGGERRTRRDFDLDDASHVYGCLQSLFKFHPDFDAVLAEILRRDPAGVLVLVGSCPAWEDVLRERLGSIAPDVLPRVRFLPRMEKELYLDCLAACDLLLDPLHFGGGNTSYEGLALGLPIVTLPGELMRGRVTYALYRQMGVEDAVVSDAASYVERAVRLGCDCELRDQVSRRILAANDVLFENQAAVAELESFLERACAENSGRFPAGSAG